MLKKTVRSTGVQILGKILSIFISLFTIRLLTGKLGIEGFGNFTLMSSIFLLFDAAADLGTRMIGVREMVQAKESDVKKIWFNIFGLRLLMTGVVFILGILFCLFYGGFNTIRTEAFLVLLMLWGTMLAGTLEIIWQYKMRLEIKTVIDVVFPALFLVWLLIEGTKISLLTVVLAYLVARALSLILGLFTVNNFLKGIKLSFDSRLIKRIFKESWPMGLYLLLFTGYDKAIDSILIRQYWGVEQVAWYGLAYKIYGNLIMPAYFFMASVFPLLSLKEEQKEVYKKSRWILLSMILVGGPLIFYLAPAAINILSRNEYLASIPVLRILILALFFSYLNHLNGFWLISRGKQRFMLKLALVVIVINIVGNLILIPKFGMVGGAWMTVISEAIMWMMTTWKIRY